MKWLTKLKEDSTDYLFDHPNLKKTLSFIFKLFVTALSAFIFAYGFRASLRQSIALRVGSRKMQVVTSQMHSATKELPRRIMSPHFT